MDRVCAKQVTYILEKINRHARTELNNPVLEVGILKKARKTMSITRFDIHLSKQQYASAQLNSGLNPVVCKLIVAHRSYPGVC